MTEQLGEVLLYSEEHQSVFVGAVVNFHFVHGLRRATARVETGGMSRTAEGPSLGMTVSCTYDSTRPSLASFISSLVRLCSAPFNENPSGSLPASLGVAVPKRRADGRSRKRVR